MRPATDARDKVTVAGLGSAGFGVRRDLSFLYRLAFWLLVGLIAASILLVFVRITEEAMPIAASIFLDVLNVFLLFLRLFARSS